MFDFMMASYHDVDSNELAFRIAGSRALKEGVQKGRPVLLEPIMMVEVVMPEEFLGDIIGQLNARRGEILGMEVAARQCSGRPLYGASCRNVRICY